ncbi:MAG: SDR family NAD(P)-dependent oxidoreductase [Candidatus Daviesbacteria bacterium]|nr:SDR family NAD(P)-dependent oxidoreductase [Candidatus Daviesbacteria bacterium]
MKTVVITGASRGIGLATARKFLSEGYIVIGTSTTGKIDIEDPNFKAVKLDISDSQNIKNAALEIEDKVDILINNAGVNEEDWDIVDIDMDVLRKTLEINLFGLIDFTEHMLSKISPNGQVINLSSRLGSFSQEGGNASDNPSYRISKAALNMYTKTLGARLENKGITVSSVHPGWVKTDMGGDDAPKAPEQAAEDIYKLATTEHESGQFWSEGQKYPW